eukprot:gene19764-11878_t
MIDEEELGNPIPQADTATKFRAKANTYTPIDTKPETKASSKPPKAVQPAATTQCAKQAVALVCSSGGERKICNHECYVTTPWPILEKLKEILGEPAAECKPLVLEIASGTGCHVEVFAPALPRHTINKHGSAAHPNVVEAAPLDAGTPFTNWPATVQEQKGTFEMVCVSNVTHISPFKVTKGICAGAGHALGVGGSLVVYGPFKIDGTFTTESN